MPLRPFPPTSSRSCAMASAIEDDEDHEYAEADQVLAAEQEHLSSSREYLRLMREDVLALPALAGDRVSQEYLRADLYRRAESLRDMPDAPLFFGRLDYASAPEPTGPPGREEPGDGRRQRGEQFHIGRRHVHDADGHPVVIDWRAPLSRPFYRASQGEPMGLARRRRFGFSGGQLTAYEDEAFGATLQEPREPQPKSGAPLSRIVIEEIERPRSGSMRDIVATIQPDQDDIVRASAAESVCVQGAPGTGKTAVGLHRVAYLLYAHRERMSRGGVLVIGPNRAFLTYIRNVLPALGEFDAEQTSVTELISAVPVQGSDAEQTARLKGDARTHEAVRRTSQVRKAVDAIWPKADPVRVVFGLLSDPETLARAADGVFSPAEQAALTWPRPPRGPGAARWSAADAVLVDEVKDMLERTPSLAHIVVDEAQDLSAMACRAVGRRCPTGSVTVLGDMAQGTTAWATPSWDRLLGHLGKPDVTLEVLTTGYRVPRQILDFASRLLGQIAPELAPATSVRQDPGSLVITAVQEAAMAAALSAASADALTRPGSIAVITADADAPGVAAALAAATLPHEILDGEHEGGQLVILPVSLAKGLEFDHVIVVEPARIAAAEARGLHRLYVALTRAVSRLTVLHSAPLPPALAHLPGSSSSDMSQIGHHIDSTPGEVPIAR